MQIDGHTRLAAVVARPIKHSISPFIHNYAFERTGVNGVYVAWDIAETDLAQTVENVRRYDMWGLNISMPYKQAVIPYLDELTASATLIGAVNTVINREGKLIGHNTDGLGFFNSLTALTGFEVNGRAVTMLGGGGAAIAIIAQAALNGAANIQVFSRTGSLARVAQTVKAIAEQTGVTIAVHSLEDRNLLQDSLNASDLLVNGTSVGMDGQSLVIDEELAFPKGLIVADVIYQPLETPLLKLARERGLTAVNGLGMLLFQAAEAFKCWTGEDMPTKEIWSALEERYR